MDPWMPGSKTRRNALVTLAGEIDESAPDVVGCGMVRWRLPTDEVWSMCLVLTNKVSTER